MNRDDTRGTRLIYLMGASGSGKDTLIQGLSASLRPDEAILIGHRYITRPRADSGENAVYLDETAFAVRQKLGLFAMHWQSHGLHYGIGIEIEAWMQAGAVVVVNGSRQHLAQAHQRYPQLCAVEIQVPPEVLAARLAGRGRESVEDIAARLARGQRRFDIPPGCHVETVDNSDVVTEAVAALASLVRRRLPHAR